MMTSTPDITPIPSCNSESHLTLLQMSWHSKVTELCLAEEGEPLRRALALLQQVPTRTNHDAVLWLRRAGTSLFDVKPDQRQRVRFAHSLVATPALFDCSNIIDSLVVDHTQSQPSEQSNPAIIKQAGAAQAGATEQRGPSPHQLQQLFALHAALIGEVGLMFEVRTPTPSIQAFDCASAAKPDQDSMILRSRHPVICEQVILHSIKNVLLLDLVCFCYYLISLPSLPRDTYVITGPVSCVVFTLCGANQSFATTLKR
eukprot:c20443_g1_i2.p1 GENE.c20443_g1_i2~~c20443_g1_i2.p1  ORF type:complete len:258 (+),score=31.69 c20443_g1_i2:241-1014(+)